MEKFKLPKVWHVDARISVALKSANGIHFDASHESFDAVVLRERDYEELLRRLRPRVVKKASKRK